MSKNPTALTGLTDFSDRLSPMLVKELRQGLRSKGFISLFLSLQGFLALILFSASAASTSERVGTTISEIIFILFSLAVLVVQPLRGANSLSSEIKANTIDMMVLTRLSSRRIVFGKWVALVSQSALMLVAIIPYLILRYFFGSMNLFAEMVLVGMIFLTSMTLTACTVSISGAPSVLLRALIPIIGTPALVMMIFQTLTGYSFRNLIEVCSFNERDTGIGLGIYAGALVYLGWVMLSLGSSLIAPAAENHSTLPRLVTLGIMLAVIPLGLVKTIDHQLVLMAGAIVAIPAIIVALTEGSRHLQWITTATDRSPLRRLLGWFLDPGWPSGVFFTLVLAIIYGMAWLVAAKVHAPHSLFQDDEVSACLACFGGLLFPAAALSFGRQTDGTRIASYLLILIASILTTAVMGGLASSMGSTTMLWFFVINPLMLLPLIANNSFMGHSGFGTDSDILLCAVVVDSVLFLILAARAAVAIRYRARHTLEQT